MRPFLIGGNMAAQATTDYHPTHGYINTLRVSNDDMVSIKYGQGDDKWEVKFRDAIVVSEAMPATEADRLYVKKSDLEDRSKYWETKELIKQLTAFVEHLEQARDNFRTRSEAYAIRASDLRSIINDLENGSDIWEVED